MQNILSMHDITDVGALQMYDNGLYAGPPKEIVQGRTRLLWGPRNRLRRLSK